MFQNAHLILSFANKRLWGAYVSGSGGKWGSLRRLELFWLSVSLRVSEESSLKGRGVTDGVWKLSSGEPAADLRRFLMTNYEIFSRHRFFFVQRWTFSTQVSTMPRIFFIGLPRLDYHQWFWWVFYSMIFTQNTKFIKSTKKNLIPINTFISFKISEVCNK